MKSQKIFFITALIILIITTFACILVKPQMHKSFQTEIIIFKKVK